MPNYTPGPWRAQHHITHSRIHAEDRHIATVHLNRSHEEYERILPETADANAHLIAAAPELLEACEEALSEVKAFSARTGIPQFLPWLDRVEKALNKAKGK